MNKNTFKIVQWTFVISTVFAMGGGIGYWAAMPQSAEKTALAESSAKPAVVERKILYWYDPMVPDQRFDKPGKSPFMDMQLVPQYADDSANQDGAGVGNSAGVKIDPRIVQNLGVRTAPVTRGTLASPLDVAANVQLNNRQVAIVQARSGGFVERVYARVPGDVIARGAPLVDLLVPEWTGAQNEFLGVLKTGDQGLIQAVRERLRSLGMSSGLIAQVEKSGQAHAVVTITAPIGGLIQTLEARTGMAVTPGATLAQINGLDPVWIEAAIPEAQAGQAAVGRHISASLAAYPGEKFEGKVAALLPEADRESRTLRVRIELPNRDGRIKPGMFAQVRLDAGKSVSALLIQSEAVIRTGKRNVVLVALQGGRFQPVEVKLGQEGDGQVAVLNGLEEGQDIVVSGQFLIDSEASLKGVVARMDGAGHGSAKAGDKP